MVHRWVHRSTLVATALLVLACDPSAPSTTDLLGPWQARPFEALDGGLAATAEGLCPERLPQAADLTLVLHDQRGRGIDTVLYAGPTDTATCQVLEGADGSVTFLTGGASSGAPGEIPGPLSLLVDSMVSSSGSDVETVSEILGRTGAGVVAVRILLSDGNEVLATTSNGWFYAWWPGDATAASLAGDDATGRMVTSVTP
jgi:hypothetical protein